MNRLDVFDIQSMGELEQARSYHEDLERLERLLPYAAQEAMQPKQTRSAQLLNEHTARQIIDAIMAITHRLIHFYEQQQHQYYNHRQVTNADADHYMFGLFYENVKDIIVRAQPQRCCRSKYSSRAVIGGGHADDRDSELLADVAASPVQFSGAEACGRFLDLHGLYNLFRNSDTLVPRRPSKESKPSPPMSKKSRHSHSQFHPHSTTTPGYEEPLQDVDIGLSQSYDEASSQVKSRHSHSQFHPHSTTTPGYEEPLQDVDIGLSQSYDEASSQGKEELDTKFLFTYSQYLEEFPCFTFVPHKDKLSRAYNNYLSCLMEYLVSFFDRTRPLQDINAILLSVERDFERHWHACAVSGWEDEATEELNGKETVEEVFDSDCSLEQLVELGPIKLKCALVSLGLKAGGSIQHRAERLLLAKQMSRSTSDLQVSAFNCKHKSKITSKEVALAEMKAMRLCELLRENIEDTKAHVERMEHILSNRDYEYEKGELMDHALFSEDEDEASDGEKRVYNPLGIPIGVDGNPIPYWLFKLHGLGQEFKCEICGNASYWGRRAFEKHFTQDPRHQRGMRCLGIPNSKIFNEITSIQHAKSLWETTIRQKQACTWQPELEEEHEDDQGNIYDKKSYLLLQREGLVP
ncbi:hypothetical protein GOP47_0013125 [Adiantum capillus-veneris]|uniref:Uncharacterized protein n=1 Tax=Adiantum capillus-veneris TaxID=13818 RepID=A0A9D4USF1_ADICA|nr:hypothetical protein GOP47_0013125 [Adiantum capillus-veneris]